ncbi:MAG: N-acetyltransferase [Azospirillaceae bacterium]
MTTTKMAAETRPARRDEARLIGRFVAMAGDGLAEYNWSTMAEAGEQPLDVAERRLSRPAGEADWSFENARLAVDAAGRVIGALVAFGVPDRPSEPVPEDADPVMRPLMVLEAPSSFYVAAIAVEPEMRGSGVGRALLGEAERLAREAGYARMSLVAFEENIGAVGLYRRLGYVEAGREPLSPHPMVRRRGDAILMVKTLPTA